MTEGGKCILYCKQNTELNVFSLILGLFCYILPDLSFVDVKSRIILADRLHSLLIAFCTTYPCTCYNLTVTV